MGTTGPGLDNVGPHPSGTIVVSRLQPQEQVLQLRGNVFQARAEMDGNAFDTVRGGDKPDQPRLPVCQHFVPVLLGM